MTKAFKTTVSAPAYTVPGGTSSQYLMADGSVSTGGSGVKYTFASTPPSSPSVGDVWTDSGDGTEYTYINDGDSYQWVELSNAGLPGPTGSKGDTGLTGQQGLTGPAGPSGAITVNSPIVNSGTSTLANLSLSGALPSTVLATDGTISSTTQVGYMGLPQNLNPTSPYTVTAADNGKHIYMTTTGGTITIPANGTLALPIGFSFAIINAGSVSTSIAITTDTMYLAGAGTTGTRTLAAYGMATAVKITSTSWIISGNGLT